MQLLQGTHLYELLMGHKQIF